MATSNRNNTASLVNLLRNTVEAQVLAKLQGAVHEAVGVAIDGVVVQASQLQAVPQPAPQAPAAQDGGRPVEGGRCRAIWDWLDYQAAAGKETTLAQMKAYADKRKWNGNTARIQFYRWRAHRAAHQAARGGQGATQALPVVRTASYTGPDRRAH